MKIDREQLRTIVSAIEENNTDVLRQIFSECKFVDIGFFTELDGEVVNPFAIAASRGNFEALRTLLRFAKARGWLHLVNKITDYRTPIMEISRRNALPCLQLLLKYRASANRRAERGMSALWHAIDQNHSDKFINLLLKHTDLKRIRRSSREEELLIEAALRGRTEIVSLLMENGFSVDFYDETLGNTILAIAIHDDNDEMVDTIVEHICRNGFQRWSLCNDGLDAAIDMDNVTVARKLIHAGFDVSSCKYFYRDEFEIGWNALEIVLKAGAGLHGVSKHFMIGSWQPEEQCRVLPLVWEYMTQSDWICLCKDSGLQSSQCFKELSWNVHTLRELCRKAIRETVMMTGRYSSIYKAHIKSTGLPSFLCNYILYI